MLALSILLIPLFSAVVLFLLGTHQKRVSSIFLFSTAILFVFTILGLTIWNQPVLHHFSANWLPSLGSSFSLSFDPLASILCLLNALVYFLLAIYLYNKPTEKPAAFYGWLLLAQAGMMGVFLATDGLLFYFFWELALIPMYFLSSIWGGARRIAVTFKFFIYTFLGSVLMLAGLIYLPFPLY
jgi:NADH-quinone oxidoreductase subunit M